MLDHVFLSVSDLGRSIAFYTAALAPLGIDDEWIDDIEKLDEALRDFTVRRAKANAFDLRYADDVDASGPPWESCERVLARRDVTERLSRGWGEHAAPQRKA
ncbi:hypothetical protein [Methylobacterium sp. BTF04]|uniref:hypothetical protein n=1 Tax=Methylobacterium sp. BTF04 TaxID=2708300 RepID=UPI001FEFA5D7|nr:hypothetical protein [Methylobacterium sp. BTF04]